MEVFNLKQYVQGDYCLVCLGCCRYNCNPSIWAPNLLEEEGEILGLAKIELLAHDDSYVCCFLNPQNNSCKIYTQRPLECRLYPFLLNCFDNKLYLSVDKRCPHVLGKSNSREFKKYQDYLIRYLRNPAVYAILKKNLEAFSSYPAGEVLNLIEIKVE